MHYCKVEGGIVVNVAVFDGEMPEGWASPGDIWVADEQGQIGWLYSDGALHPPAPPELPPPDAALIDAERERRIAAPLTVSVSVGPIAINMDAAAQRNLQGLASVGQYLKAAGSSQTTEFRDFDNNSHALTPDDLVVMGLQVASRIQAVYAASWSIKALDPIPADYADDARWPA